MSKHSVRAARAEVRAHMAEHGVNYTTAARAVAEAKAGDSGTAAPAGPPPADDRFGGHEFEYEQSTDLFRCTECEEYEVVAQQDDGSFTRCPGLVGWAGDPERVYLLVTENSAIYNASWHVSRAARDLRIGRGVRFGYRDGRYLVESAPSVVDKLRRVLAALTEIPSTATKLPKPGGERVAVATAIEPLTFEQGQAVIAANYAAYVQEYGEPDRPAGAAVTVHTLVVPEGASLDDGDDSDEYGDGSGWSSESPELDYYD